MYQQSKILGWLTAALAAGALLASVSIARAADSSKEYQIKAAFLYNFAKFVEWPTNTFASSDAPIVIGIIGKNPFGNDLEKAVRDRFVNGHPVQIKFIDEHFTNVTSHVLFFAPGEGKPASGFLSKVASLPILTVGDGDQFLEQGGMINFLFEADKVRFQINSEAARRAGLKISANLQKLAVKMHPK